MCDFFDLTGMERDRVEHPSGRHMRSRIRTWMVTALRMERGR
jgi:hypothetical protein